MNAKIEAFLSLEGTVAAQMDRLWRKKADRIIRALSSFLEAGDFTGAYLYVQNVDMHGVVQEVRNEIEHTLISCLLFGAQQHLPIADTYLMQRPAIPQELHTAIDQLVILIEDDASEMIRRACNDFIRSEEETAKQTQMGILKADADELADALNAAVLGTGKAFINIGANVTTSRLVSYGFLSQAMEVGATTYQITEVLDGKTCPFCRMIHGKTFTVENELSRLKTVLSMQDPADLKSAAPWPSQSKASIKRLRSMSEEELQSEGYGSPPYHPNCRGVLVVVGSVQEEVPSIAPDGLPDHLTPSVDGEPITIESTIADTVAGIRAFLRRKPKNFKKPTPPALQHSISQAFRVELDGGTLSTAEIRAVITSIEDAIDLQAAVNALDNRDADTLRMLLQKYGFIPT